MPYNEYKQQAWQYYNTAILNLEMGNIGTARSHFSMARAIAVKNGMNDLIKLIDDKLKEIGSWERDI